jgi:RNA polymerase sigma-70 factor (ECF subfamily)
VSDASLIERAARGDVHAFAQIYDRHASTMLALARRILLSAGDAQDLLHDVFLEAWLSAREYDPQRGSLRVWLLVRTRSRALDRRGRSLREQSANESLARGDAGSSSRATQPEPERQIAVRQALATLEPSARQTLELTYFEGLTALEVAARMGVPEGTVKSRLARGLDTLERVFGLLEETR